MARKTRRTRSPHPGVKLKKRALPSGGVSYRAHYLDPDLGREVAFTLPMPAARTAEARRQWAIAKSEQLARTRMDRNAGIRPPPQGEPIADAIDGFLSAATTRLRASTLTVYSTAFSRLRDWAKAQRVMRTAELTKGRLVALREHLIQLPRSANRGGPRRTTRRQRTTTQHRSPTTVNGELRAIKTLVNHWRRSDLTPFLSSDDITDALPMLRVEREPPPYLRPPEVEALLRAALRHDAECFTLTREEHHGLRAAGSTVRHAPVAPFITFMLMAGCRFGEARALRWDAVDLDALDEQREATGRIQIHPETTKTKQARTVTLRETPALRRLLTAMHERASGELVFSGSEYSAHALNGARRRLMQQFDAPTFDWKLLRSTCATYLTNAPDIYGAASAYRSATRLGHHVVVATKHYLGVINIPHGKKTLEAAMESEEAVNEVIASVRVE